VSSYAATTLPATLSLEELGGARPLARGASGTVEEVELASDGPLVLKRFFRPESVKAAALRELVRWRRELGDQDQHQLDRVAMWPLAVVEADDVLVGFVMHRVPDAFVQTVRLPSGRRREVLREAQYVFASDRAHRLQVPIIKLPQRLGMILSLVEAIHFLHRRRVVVGDLSSRNVLWDSDPARVLLVDCDSMFLGGVGSALPAAFTVDWDDPAEPAGAAASSDVYKLGLFVLRVLIGSFQARQADLAEQHLDVTGRLLLRASLSPEPDARPKLDAWARWAAGRRAVVRASPHLPDPDTKDHDND
jgi:hypothetical protein